MIFKSAQIEKYFKNPDLNIKAILIFGQNEGLATEYCRRLTQTVTDNLQDPFCVKHLDWSEIKNNIGILVSEYSAQSLLSSRRAVILNNGDNDLTKVISEYIEKSSSNTLLIINGISSLNLKSSLVNYFADSNVLAHVGCYEDRENDIIASVKQILASHQVTCSPEAFELLCSRMSNDRKANINEIEKLITYIGTKKTFDIKDVKQIVFDASVSIIDDLCFHVFSGEKDKTFNDLNNLLEEGVEETLITRAIYRHLTTLLEGKSLVEKGINEKEAAKKLIAKKLFYYYDIAARQIRLWPKEKLFNAISLIYTAEKECKTKPYPTADIVGNLILTILRVADKLFYNK